MIICMFSYVIVTRNIMNVYSSVFLGKDQLVKAREVCKQSSHANCIAYDKMRCKLDGISDDR